MAGLLGSVHCAALCGGIVSHTRASGAGAAHRSSFPLAYNAGRIASYVLAGALAGLLGQAAWFCAVACWSSTC